ncbi:MAG TPA: hypothetical protein VN683_01055 [Acidothermaceae bacterium]|nr:hypothetical protein [Acidothermaceae bacterium]
MGAEVALSTLLSQALVAYTVEFDNETDHLLPHRTSDHGATAALGPRPWLVSLVMWCNCMKFVGPDGVQLGEMERANVLRVLDDGVRVRDFPILTGVSKEAVAMSVGFLEKHGCVTVEPVPPPGRGQRVRLTPRGHIAQQVTGNLVVDVEDHWQTRFSTDAVRSLRSSLEPLVGDGAPPSPLFGGLTPYPNGWRADVRTPSTLPHFPMVLHRGGYPDGS